MKLHEDKRLFTQLLNFAANALNIRPEFIEKDYWLTRALQRMALNKNTEKVVFKGGTSLAKAYRLTNRFSEDIDIAVIDANSFSGNQLKMLIKRIAKDMASDLEEIVIPDVTSKGSRFYKAIYQYQNLVGLTSSTVKAGQLLIEINTYANPYPYIKQDISSFLSKLLIHDQQEFDRPRGWQTKTVKDSPLFKEFPTLWTDLSSTYQSELTPLAFSEIPDEKLVAENFMKIMEKL